MCLTYGLESNFYARHALRLTLAGVVLVLLLGNLARAADGAVIDPLDSYLRDALSSNSALRAEGFAVDAALQGLEAARARRAPVLALAARYTVSDGGRTIDIPTGDLVNPVYRTLNQLTAGSANPTQFPEIDNNTIRFLRPHEQDTRLSLTAPLYAPQIGAEIAIRAAQLDSSLAAREAYARTLVRDVKVAYYQLARAQAGVAVLEASRSSLAENLRTAAALVAAGKATRDQRLRADAELFAIEQRLQTAGSSERAARRYLNLLRNRDEAAPIEVAAIAGDDASSPAEASEPRHLRPELRGLDAQIGAAEGSRKLAQAAYRPTLALVADSGIQGTGYRFDQDSRVSTASLVLSWTLFDFGQRRAAVSQARAQAEQLRSMRRDTQRQLTLARQNAADDLDTARDALATAAARRAAAEESFRIAERKRDAGQLNQVEFLDAERARTEAVLGLVIARSGLQIAGAELEYTQASFDLPAHFDGSRR